MQIKIINTSKTKKYGLESFRGKDFLYIYCGRGSRLGNPYRIGMDGTRSEVLQKHRVDKEVNKEIDSFVNYIKTQRPKKLILGCWCNTDCHCDYIKERVDAVLNPTLF